MDSENADTIPGLKAVIGVGGTFDYWAGTAKRAYFFEKRRLRMALETHK